MSRSRSATHSGLRTRGAAQIAASAPHPLLADALAGKPPELAHLDALCHHLGVVQFANGDTRDLDSGFCVDDNARALIVAVDVLDLDSKSARAHRIGAAALDLLERTQLPDGGFHNMLDAQGERIEENGLSDAASGRALWALGITVARSNDESWRSRAGALLKGSWNCARRLKTFRPQAYALLGAAAAAKASPQAKRVADELSAMLLDAYERAATPQWPWWEPNLTWGNARLPEAMLRAAGVADAGQRLAACGLRTLEFLASITQEDGVFVPIGNDGWYEQGRKRARHDQQPIEAAGMVDAWLAAAERTRDDRYWPRALEAFAWFLGVNSERLIVADLQTGGCRDGLGLGWRNRNMGAESTLSYLQAHCAIARFARARAARGA
ncbi:MAG: hypothetical protein JO219_07165 [Candidatus Eremiobacteraeota bacterium]|nr:hypothetical protein [Candidatus Eremiobacteraeota bacterium]MBV8365514.1 hypothetical protein [Candidatus Eremiobacteraeota bacterium]